MSESRHYLNLKQEETNFHLWGLKEFEYHLLRESSLPIKINMYREPKEVIINY